MCMRLSTTAGVAQVVNHYIMLLHTDALGFRMTHMAKVKEITKAAAMLGALGGKSTSPRKVRAARKNGKRGGRPRKAAQ